MTRFLILFKQIPHIMATNSMFNVIPALDLNAERDVFMGLPVESNTKQTFYRIPIRSSSTESASGDRRMQVKLVPGQTNVVQSIQGLQRLLIKFPQVFVPGIKVFEANNENDRTNMSMGFALYDFRTGPSTDETQMLKNLDGLAMFLRQTMVRCDRIRRVLKLGENMTPQQQQVAVEIRVHFGGHVKCALASMMDLHVARPLQERSDASVFRGANAAGQPDDRPPPARYCYVKLVAPDPAVNEKYHTYFWTLDGQPIKFDTVLGFRNFQVQPYVEVEDVFVSKVVRSLQLKLRECLVIPPAERIQHRFSVCFPDRVCTVPSEEDAKPNDTGLKREADLETIELPPAKKPHVDEESQDSETQDTEIYNPAAEPQ